MRLAQLVLDNAEELASIEARDCGKPTGMSDCASSAQISATVPRIRPCAVSAHSSLQRFSSQSFSASSVGKRGMGCQSR